ncbi:hypothetical protein M407DRAFT_31866 [Tulasnella calospora MUT 4182]|uniref:Uncharacterized protein n=1 Tax=Tulasnella calospora MUT 4182 TaxID=1051891 RepID=A0A0C3Q4Z9_9AGAM|nr:hypothetical protein M407DRAFT_31866 [Tulasnella calospora MUT 4182]
MAEDDEEDEGAVEAIIDRGETRSMIHVDLADAEDLGQYNISRLLDGPITPTGQRRWVDTLTRNRYLELGHHVIDTMRASLFRSTPHKATTSIAWARSLLPRPRHGHDGHGEQRYCWNDHVLERVEDRSTPSEGVRRRKIPYRACRERATFVTPQAQQQQRPATSLTTPPPSARGSRTSSRRSSRAVRITKPLP